MNKRWFSLTIILLVFTFIFSIMVKMVVAGAGNQNLAYEELDKPDPFIPWIDEKGNLRKDFTRPEEVIAPKVTLMGISKVGNSFYALIDGELLREGEMFKELKIEKIYSDRVIVLYANKVFEIKWDAGKTNEKK